MSRRSPPNGSSDSGMRAALMVAVLFLIVLLTGLFVPLPEFSRFVGAGFDMVHAPMFAALTCLIAKTVRLAFTRRTAWTVAVAVAALIAVSTEFSQGFVGRTTSTQDLVANLLGIAAGCCFAQDPRRRSHLVVSGCLLLAASVWPLAVCYDHARQRRQMPVLASFEDRLELSRWETQDASIRQATEFASDGRTSLQVDLDPAEFPGITFYCPPPDWTRYQSLHFEISAETTAATPVVLKITDAAHNDEPWDRFHQHIVLKPGMQHISIPLSHIVAAPRDRRLDRSRIAVVQFFAASPNRPIRFYLDHVRLE